MRESVCNINSQQRISLRLYKELLKVNKNKNNQYNRKIGQETSSNISKRNVKVNKKIIKHVMIPNLTSNKGI